MSNRTQLIELEWNMNLGRYLVFHKSKCHLHEVCIKLINLDIHPSMKALHDGILAKIDGYDLFDDLDDVYFCAVKPIYVNLREKIMVDIQTTESVLFNTPINLMYTAAVGADFDRTFVSDETEDLIARVQRHNLWMGISADVSNYGSYIIHLQLDCVTLNELHPRSIQFAHVAQLIRCDEFVERMTNGNLLLAMADSYFNNADDDVIDITHVGKIRGIYYDQFTGSIAGNMIEVTTGDGTVEYEANSLDAPFIDILQQCIAEKLKPEVDDSTKE